VFDIDYPMIIDFLKIPMVSEFCKFSVFTFGLLMNKLIQESFFDGINIAENVPEHEPGAGRVGDGAFIHPPGSHVDQSH